MHGLLPADSTLNLQCETILLLYWPRGESHGVFYRPILLITVRSSTPG